MPFLLAIVTGLTQLSKPFFEALGLTAGSERPVKLSTLIETETPATGEPPAAMRRASAWFQDLTDAVRACPQRDPRYSASTCAGASAAS